MSSYRLLVHSADQVVQVVKNGELKVASKKAMNELAIMSKKERNGISIVVNQSGNIVDLGYDDDVRSKHSASKFDKIIDASGTSIIPGFVDAHTHPVWAGDRVHEFAMKLAGASYMEIHAAGGGILYTVEKTRAASEDELLQLLLPRLSRMLRSGTTMVEAKSGYGLNAHSEVKMLKVLERAKDLTPLDISSTFCGAHAVPKGSDSATATQNILEDQLPFLQSLMANGELSVDNIDVFCEKGVFDVSQSESILKSGRKMGLRLNFHADELSPLGGAEMGARLNAEAISHLEEISEAGIRAMAASGSVAVLLPTTAYILRLKAPPARDLIDSGVTVALGSDFNPNAFCLAMPLVMNLACVLFKMSLEESLMAATINSAAALGKSRTHGSIENGKIGDFLILQVPRWEHIVYQMASYQDVIKYVVKAGKIVHENTI